MFFGTSDANNYGVAIGGLRAGTTGEPSFLIKMLNDSITGSKVFEINSSGEIGIGIDPVASVKLYADAGANNHASVFRAATAGYSATIFDNTAASGTRYFVDFRISNSMKGSITSTGSSTSYNTTSDYRLKENVDYDWDATTRLKQLKPVRFNFKDDPDTTVDGFLAHEAQAVVPDAVTGTKDEVDNDGNAVNQGIDQSKLVPLLVKTIQELEARITTLEG